MSAANSADRPAGSPGRRALASTLTVESPSPVAHASDAGQAVAVGDILDADRHRPAWSTLVANINLLIGTPAYAGQVHVDYLSALLAFQRESIPFTLMTVANESLITRARNAIISAFHERRDLTHLLFLDGDVHLPREGLARMLGSGKDVVGAPVALKGVATDGARLFNVGNTIGEDGTLLVVERVGIEAVLLSRAAADALVTDARREQRVYERSPALGDGSIQYDVFRVGVVDGEYLSEDFWVCRVLRRLGFAIHVDPTVVTRRNGVVVL